MKTNFLGLDKPRAGSLNWGSAMNNNLDTIDREYAKLNNNLSVIESRVKDIGTFGFISYRADNTVYDVDYLQPVQCMIRIQNDYYIVNSNNLKTIENDGKPYYYWNISSVSKANNATINNYQNNINFGSIRLGSEKSRSDGSKYFVQDIKLYNEVYYNDNDTSHKQLSSFSDFTAFYLSVPFYCEGVTENSKDLKSITSLYIFGLELHFDGILIKTSQLENNQYVTLLSKFKQVLGGYYTPTSITSKPNTIIFNKSAASGSTDSVEIFIPRSVANSTETLYSFTHSSSVKSVTIDTNIKYDLTSGTGTDSINFSQNISNINFFIGSEIDNNNVPCKRTPIILDYELLYHDNQGWQIIVDTTYLISGTTYYVSWVMLAPNIDQNG